MDCMMGLLNLGYLTFYKKSWNNFVHRCEKNCIEQNFKVFPLNETDTWIYYFATRKSINSLNNGSFFFLKLLI